jgi:hypothetical protein
MKITAIPVSRLPLPSRSRSTTRAPYLSGRDTAIIMQAIFKARGALDTRSIQARPAAALIAGGAAWLRLRRPSSA